MRYEYACEHCDDRMTLRRPIDQMDDPVESLCCGAPASRVFTPTSNIFVPVAFRQVLTGGAPGGGQTSWSDIFDCSERELAHMKDDDGNPVEVMPYNRALSQPGVGFDRKVPKPAFTMGDAYNEVRQMPDGMRRELAATLPGQGVNDG